MTSPDQALDPPTAGSTELRLGVVLNGGVSLAVWIGGVTHELDALRLAVPPSPTGAAPMAGDYSVALGGRHTSARIDVIAGASAGGINGALLAAAIQGTTSEGPRALRGANGESLRDVWLRLGDVRKLSRSPKEEDPTSLLRGDDYLLPGLTKQLNALLVPDAGSELPHPLYLYITATDLRGMRRARYQTSDELIEEPDHRVVFRFSAKPEIGLGDEPTAAPDDPRVLDEVLLLDRTNALRLARAARSSSSFPGAFAPHHAVIARGAENVSTFLADGGILDNQPIRPLLDRIRLMKVEEPIRRIIFYVVPYVSQTQVAEWDDARPRPGEPSLLEVMRSGGLARDLPKLESLQRAERDLAEGHSASVVDDLLRDRLADLVPAAAMLLSAYREVQAAELRQTLQKWDANLEVGTGPLGGIESVASEQEITPPLAVSTTDWMAAVAGELPPSDWELASASWQGYGPAPAWTWGFTKAERFGRTALTWLQVDGPDEPALNEARLCASNLGIAARAGISARRTAFVDLRATGLTAPEAFSASLEQVTPQREAVAEAFESLCETLAVAMGWGEAGIAREFLMAIEVTMNAAGTRPLPSPKFDFYRITAKGSVEGHSATLPEEKLAGMQLSHFAAFLKKSWRANDWMWGRLDAVRHLGHALYGDDAVARETWIKMRQMVVLREELPRIAAAIEDDEKEGFSQVSAFSSWRRAHASVLADIAAGTADDASVRSAFGKLEIEPSLLGEERGARATVAAATTLMAVASRALSSDKSGVPVPLRAAVAATRRTTGITNTLTQIIRTWPPAGFAIILALGALAVVLATNGGVAAAWIGPALVGLAIAGAWTGYGWLSSPPTLWRAVVLLAIATCLIIANYQINAPGALDDRSTWRIESWAVAVWWAAVVAACVTAALALAYGFSAVYGKRIALSVRDPLGLALAALLALWLGRVAWDGVVGFTGEHSGWRGYLEEHAAIRALLIVVVVLTLTVQTIGVFQSRRASGSDG